MPVPEQTKQTAKILKRRQPRSEALELAHEDNIFEFTNSTKLRA